MPEKSEARTEQEPGLTDEDIKKLQEILEANRQCGTNEYTGFGP